MNYISYYIEAYLACFFLLAIILYNIVRGVNRQVSQIYLENLIINLMLYFLAEIFWIVADSSSSPDSIPTKIFSNLCTYVLVTISAYCWYILSETFQNDHYVEKVSFRRILCIPILFSGVLCLSAFKSDIIFYFDENYQLHNGRYYALLVVVPFIYMVAASIKAFVRFANKDRYADRNIYFMIGIFPIAPCVLGVFQALYPKLPLLCYGAVAGALYVYITIQEGLISIDPLTQTNNRNQMYKYLVQKMRDTESQSSLFLIVVDVNRLRSVNEGYGHAEGDRALIRVAGAVKEACNSSRSRLFVSRYGGDEFAVVAEMSYRAEALWLVDQIKNDLKRATDADGANYDLSLSFGIAQYDFQAPVSIQTFIARAYSDLYQNKKISAI